MKQTTNYQNGSWSSVFNLYRPRQHVPHRIRRFFLCCGGDMGVGVEGESCGEVSEHTRHRLDVHPILQCDGGESVPEIVKSDFWQSCSFEDPLQHMIYAVWGDGAAVG